jgi:hypothetical protein
MYELIKNAILEEFMKKFEIAALTLVLAMSAVGCGAGKNDSAEIIGGADGPTSIFLATNEETNGEDGTGSDNVNIEASVADEYSLTGTWQTASIGYEADDTMQPEYYVQFYGMSINYGHMKDGDFVLDHTDAIDTIESVGSGCKIQAVSESGVKYTYQTSEGDENVLDYYGTWEENEFADNYSAGASLSRVLE